MSNNDAQSSTSDLRYVQYHGSKESAYLPAIRQLISKDLSEPYSIYVYRYFLYQWGHLCYMALDPSSNLIGVVVCKLEYHRSGTFRGYIAMLAVQETHRGKGIATQLVCMAIDAMAERDADEVDPSSHCWLPSPMNKYPMRVLILEQIVLETEVTNTASLKLYERLGFLRSKRLHRYYLNGNTAFRLVLYLKLGTGTKRPQQLDDSGELPAQYGYPATGFDETGMREGHQILEGPQVP